MTYIVALEGSPLTGKTTLGKRISRLIPNSIYFPDYVEMLNWINIPDHNPGSTENQVNAFIYFMNAELCRHSIVNNNPSIPLVVLDRSVDTLLSHAFALDYMYGYSSFGKCREILKSSSYLTPDFTILLSANTSTLNSRFKLRETDDSCRPYIDSEFLDISISYFDRGYSISHGISRNSSEDVENLIPSSILDIVSSLC